MFKRTVQALYKSTYFERTGQIMYSKQEHLLKELVQKLFNGHGLDLCSRLWSCWAWLTERLAACMAWSSRGAASGWRSGTVTGTGCEQVSRTVLFLCWDCCLLMGKYWWQNYPQESSRGSPDDLSSGEGKVCVWGGDGGAALGRGQVAPKRDSPKVTELLLVVPWPCQGHDSAHSPTAVLLDHTTHLP